MEICSEPVVKIERIDVSSTPFVTPDRPPAASQQSDKEPSSLPRIINIQTLSQEDTPLVIRSNFRKRVNAAKRGIDTARKKICILSPRRTRSKTSSERQTVRSRTKKTVTFAAPKRSTKAGVRYGGTKPSNDVAVVQEAIYSLKLERYLVTLDSELRYRYTKRRGVKMTTDQTGVHCANANNRARKRLSALRERLDEHARHGNASLVRYMRDAYFHKTELLYDLVGKLNTAVLSHAELTHLLSPGYAPVVQNGRDGNEYTVATDTVVKRCINCAMNQYAEAYKDTRYFYFASDARYRLREYMDGLALGALQRAQLHRDVHSRRISALDILVDNYEFNRYKSMTVPTMKVAIGAAIDDGTRRRGRITRRVEQDDENASTAMYAMGNIDEYPVSRPRFLAECIVARDLRDNESIRFKRVVSANALPFTSAMLARLVVLANARGLTDGQACLNALNAYVFNCTVNVIIGACFITVLKRGGVDASQNVNAVRIDATVLAMAEESVLHTDTIKRFNARDERLGGEQSRRGSRPSAHTLDALWSRTIRQMRALHRDIDIALIERAVVWQSAERFNEQLPSALDTPLQRRAVRRSQRGGKKKEPASLRISDVCSDEQ